MRVLLDEIWQDSRPLSLQRLTLPLYRDQVPAPVLFRPSESENPCNPCGYMVPQAPPIVKRARPGVPGTRHRVRDIDPRRLGTDTENTEAVAKPRELQFPDGDFQGFTSRSWHPASC